MSSQKIIEQAIKCIRAAYNHYKTPIGIQQYKEYAKKHGLIGYDYILYHTGKTWRELVKLAGVPSARSGPYSTRILTRDDIINYIIKAAKIQGYFPTFLEYLEVAKKNKFPSRKTIARFGTWDELNKEAQGRVLKLI